MRRLLAAFARNEVFANILLMAVIFSGAAASQVMIREIFPEMEIETVTVEVVYPGADPEEVEEGISRKIEEAVEGLEGVKQVTTRSNEGRGTAIIEIYEGYDLAKAKDDIETRVDAINTFPVDAERPIVTQFTFSREVMLIALTGPLGERGLKEWAEEIKDELRGLPNVSQVSVSGTREYEIAIEVSEERLREYGLTFSHVANAVRQSSLNRAGGTLRTKGEEIRLRTIGRKYWGPEFEQIVVKESPEGALIRVGDVAAVKDAFEEDPLDSRFNAQPAVLLHVAKTSTEDAITISETVEEYVAEKQKVLPEGVGMTMWGDTSIFIEQRIALLVNNGLVGLAIVFLLLWAFLDLRLSFWGSMGIPISLAGGLAVLMFVGGTINMMSLFGLIMVLGIVVDDAIVVGEAIYYHRKNGAGPLAAAVDGVMEVGLPVFAAVTTTILAFMPLFFISGIMGKFIRILPTAVISALAISLLECLVMMPAHLAKLPDPNDPKRRERQRRNPFRRMRRNLSEGMEWFVHHAYTPFLRRCLAWRYVAVAVALSVLLTTVGLWRGGIVKFEMFPKVDGNDLTATVEFPNGTPVAVTRAAVERIEEAIYQLNKDMETKSGDPLVTNVFSVVGNSLGRGTGEGMTGGGSHVGSVRVEMLESADRGIHSRRIKAEWEDEIGRLAGATALTIEAREAGPPGKAIEMWVQGQSMDRILAVSDELVDRLKEFEGVSQVQSDFRPGKNEMKFRLKPSAKAMGLTVNDLASQVYAGYFGEEALRVQRGRDDIRVRVRYPAGERSQLSDLKETRIRTPLGHLVPLSSVADMDYGPGYSGITRTDGMRRVAVTADVDTDRANTREIVQEVERDFLPALLARYPDISVSQQGAKKDSQESLGSLLIGFPLALIGIFVIIATIFRSYAQPFIIMFTVPFGIIGAIFAHLIMGLPLTLLSMFGIVALAGVVVNDAIVLIERVNNYMAEGVKFFDALAKGGARRFRAIFLTTATTVGGLTPMILETDLQAQFLIPMALSIAGGVAFATLLTLVLIPCMLAILNDIRRTIRRGWTGSWPTPEDVEPAAKRLVDDLDSQPRLDPAHEGVVAAPPETAK